MLAENNQYDTTAVPASPKSVDISHFVNVSYGRGCLAYIVVLKLKKLNKQFTN